ncbi:membrane protein insertase YidC [Plebeiibacterium sediminum]|uniref:Membrane protein insertase YidC n=1 Tax=Plebeiibacterium sediminum TaxID=2992112 RepID=A0AAE3M143_9BACT|nr:membrane protein insertase YidC [Plebeiobacterium sediminum]MCW3785351.1 membrane protein insertase YidC [Plebeiobacterium sediminum]
MDKNSVTGLVLISIIIGVFMWWTQPTEEQKAAQKRYQDSIQQVELAKEKAALEFEKKKEAENTIAFDENTADSTIQKELTNKYGLFAHVVTGENQLYTLENSKIKVKFSSKGAKVYSVELKDFKAHNGQPLILFDGDKNVFGFNFFHNNRILNTNDLYYTIDQSATTDSTLSFKLSLGDDQYMAINYQLPADAYMLDFNFEQNSMDDIIQSNRGGFDLNWNLDLLAQEKGRKNEIQYSGVYFKYDQDEIDDIAGKSGEETFRTPVKWVAYKDQFFSSVLIAKDAFSSGSTSIAVHSEEENTPYISTNKTELVIPYEGGAHNVKSFQFFFGPNKFKILKKYKDLGLKDLIPLGWGIFGWVNRYIVIPIFNWLEGSIASYGLIIFILTLIIKLGLFPLTYKSYMSTAKMKVLKPQIDEINEKIPAEKSMERQKATMALYQKAGVSPLGGCLPMVLQMPILFAMFRFFPNSIELRQQSFLWATDLSTYDSILQLPWNIPFYGDHVSLFCLLMSITNIVYTKMNQEMTQSTSQMPGMKGMMYMMPVMFLVFFNNYASGLSYYYFISTLITILQTVLIRRFVDEEAILAKLKANQKKPKKKSGFQARIEEMAKQQQQMQKKKRK